MDLGKRRERDTEWDSAASVSLIQYDINFSFLAWIMLRKNKSICVVNGVKSEGNYGLLWDFDFSLLHSQPCGSQIVASLTSGFVACIDNVVSCSYFISHNASCMYAHRP